MTGEELSALIKDEIGEDARLHTILDRIRDGKANLTDSELYAAITARITAQQMRRNVLSLDKREAAFVGITRERYTDTFTVFSAVQRILDAENGIHIRPKEPGFDTGRARKIGHSLEDRTVPDSTIERRARSATENFCMSHHDDCMRVNAEFRARAGLQSYAIRDGSAKCCDWCADVSGKYPANETPAGFWGRHDNCKCSILYESKRSGRQLLRGAEDNTRRWEVVPENAGAEPLVRLTHEQAMQIQQEKQLHRMTPGEVVNNPLNILTNRVERGTMRTEETFHCYGDYLREALGSAILNNPEEVQQIINEVEQLGGSVHFLKNNTKMVCNIFRGQPGEIEVDENISIGGLRHEFRHFMDDMQNGNPGLAFYLRDNDLFFEFERRGYEEELKIAEQQGLTEIADKIRNEIEKRRREIYGE